VLLALAEEGRFDSVARVTLRRYTSGTQSIVCAGAKISNKMPNRCSIAASTAHSKPLKGPTDRYLEHTVIMFAIWSGS
jgi:hypothetical protein